MLSESSDSHNIQPLLHVPPSAQASYSSLEGTMSEVEHCTMGFGLRDPSELQMRAITDVRPRTPRTMTCNSRLLRRETDASAQRGRHSGFPTKQAYSCQDAGCFESSDDVPRASHVPRWSGEVSPHDSPTWEVHSGREG